MKQDKTTNRRKIVAVSALSLMSDETKKWWDYCRAQDREWICRFFGKDETWYEETVQKIEAIKKSLPEDIYYKQAYIKMYGWIEKDGKKDLRLLNPDYEYYLQYAHAEALMLMFTHLDVYLKKMNMEAIDRTYQSGERDEKSH